VIILDTNVLSALMRDRPDAAVITWLDEQPAESIWTTAITALEVRTGLELLRTSRRRPNSRMPSTNYSVTI
jgi:predicted nucleic acid-binding protein